MPSQSFHAAVVANEQHQCQHRGCSRLRVGINAWCMPCLQKTRQYGHPAARPLRPSLWAFERRQVQQLLAANADHPGLRCVLSVLNDWSARASGDEAAFKGAREVARLARHGVSSLDLLTEAAAFSVWLQQNHHRLPDQRACDFAMSRALFALAPRPRRMTRGPGGGWPVTGTAPASQSYSPKPLPSGLAYVGAHLRTVLAPFLANVAHSLELQQQQQADLQAAMRAPLRAPQAA